MLKPIVIFLILLFTSCAKQDTFCLSYYENDTLVSTKVEYNGVTYYTKTIIRLNEEYVVIGSYESGVGHWIDNNNFTSEDVRVSIGCTQVAVSYLNKGAVALYK